MDEVTLESRAVLMIGLGLLRHDHAGGDPAQRAREPGLVHGVHAVPAGDLAGPARGAAQLPDHGRRPDRLPIANASLLDEATAAAEAMTLARARGKSKSDVFVVDATCCRRRSPSCDPRRAARHRPRRRRDVAAATDAARGEFFGVLPAVPGRLGAVRDLRPLIEAAHAAGALVVVAADLLALTLLTPPGEIGADIAVGTTQRFGVPMGFGGPHAGYMAVRDGLERSLPGRLVGVSRRRRRQPAYRLALQTREQHIRREKATSNICTAQVLLAVMAGMYAVYHGPTGCAAIARRVHELRRDPRRGLRAAGRRGRHDDAFFDTRDRGRAGPAAAVVAAPRARGHQPAPGRRRPRVGIACDETTTRAPCARAGRFGAAAATSTLTRGAAPTGATPPALRAPATSSRTRSSTAHHSETEMLRYLRSLSDKDYALDRGDDPARLVHDEAQRDHRDGAGHLAGVREHAPVRAAEQTRATRADRASWRAGWPRSPATTRCRCSRTPARRASYAGLLAIRGVPPGARRRAHARLPDPVVAHGTNAASAVMAGMRSSSCLRRRRQRRPRRPARQDRAAHDDLAAIMVTYPSTHGVFEETIAELCAIVHEHGGQVYVDGANLNALVGLAKPGEFGADVSHLNLHKTFCIPHGGGGPGVGPVGVARTSRRTCRATRCGPRRAARHAVSAAPWARRASCRSRGRTSDDGRDGLRRGDRGRDPVNANYVARGSPPHYPVLYTGGNGLVAHECILDLRPLTKATGVRSTTSPSG
jgi:glycine dehydrogenase